MDFTSCQKKCSLIGVNVSIVEYLIKGLPSRGLEKNAMSTGSMGDSKNVLYLPTENTRNISRLMTSYMRSVFTLNLMFSTNLGISQTILNNLLETLAKNAHLTTLIFT